MNGKDNVSVLMSFPSRGRRQKINKCISTVILGAILKKVIERSYYYLMICVMSDLLLVSFANDLTTRAVILQPPKATSSRVFSFAPAGDKNLLVEVEIFFLLFLQVGHIASFLKSFKMR